MDILPEQNQSKSYRSLILALLIFFVLFNLLLILGLKAFDHFFRWSSTKKTIETTTLPQKNPNQFAYLQQNTLHLFDLKTNKSHVLAQLDTSILQEGQPTLKVSPSGRFYIFYSFGKPRIKIFDFEKKIFLEDITDKLPGSSVVIGNVTDQLGYINPSGAQVVNLQQQTPRSLFTSPLRLVVYGFTFDDGRLIIGKRTTKKTSVVAWDTTTSSYTQELYTTEYSSLIGPAVSLKDNVLFFAEEKKIIKVALNQLGVTEIATLRDRIASLSQPNSSGAIIAITYEPVSNNYSVYLLEAGGSNSHAKELALSNSSLIATQIGNIGFVDRSVYFLGKQDASAEQGIYAYSLETEKVEQLRANVASFGF